MKYDVFISYSSKDESIAEEVCKYLEEEGHLRCFISFRDIPKGVEWAPVIAEALKYSSLFLAIFSSNYNASTQVNRELNMAAKRKLPLLTFKVSDDEFEGTKDYFLTAVNFVTAYPDPKEALNPLLENVRDLINARSQRGESEINLTESERSEMYEDWKRESPKTPDDQFILAQKFESVGMETYAFKWYKKAADLGHVHAAFNVAECYFEGEGTPVDEDAAFKYYNKAAEGGLSKAQVELARVYKDGGCNQKIDLKKAEQWFIKASEQDDEDAFEALEWLGIFYGDKESDFYDEELSKHYFSRYFEIIKDHAVLNEDTDSMNTLAILYSEGKGVDEDEREALKWLERSAAKGSAEAHFNLSFRLKEGTTYVIKNEKAAFDHISKAYVIKPSVAAYELAEYYNNGIGVDEDKVKAFQLYHEAAIARTIAGNSYDSFVKARYKCAKCMLDGIGTEVNIDKGLEYLSDADNREYLPAMFDAATIVFEGKYGVPENDEDAMKRFMRIYELAPDYVDINLRLGQCFAGGFGVEKDLSEGRKYLLKASELGSSQATYLLSVIEDDPEQAFNYCLEAAENGDVEAMWQVARYYLNGEGTEKDEFKSYKWMRRAAEEGDLDAENEMGEYYRLGVGVFKNNNLAYEWYEKAATKGHVCAMMNLGSMYMEGLGVDVDYEKAVYWFTKVCEAEEPDYSAFAKIGYMYETGAMGTPDISQAMLWYNKGIAGGSHYSEYYLARCYDTDEILPDYQKALSYYSKASDAGVSEASYYLADMYFDGRAGGKKPKQAFTLFKKVAERWVEIRKTPAAYVEITQDENGIRVTEEKQKEMSKEIYPLSMLRLGECYLNGIGTERNESEGTKWVAIANKLGYK